MQSPFTILTCNACNKPFSEHRATRGIDHIIEEEGRYYHPDCFTGEIPDTLKAFYAAEAKLAGKPS